jgi:MoaA/NifB/PqqE/SkfB family radical SAM enzyme/predicted Fe-Mo cluster-binding NifX family protein
LSPEEALDRFREVKERLPNLQVIGFAGPGESLSRPDLLLATLKLLAAEAQDLTLCLSTNGLALPFYASDLRAFNIRHLTVTVNAASLEVGERIYSRADYFGQVFTGPAAAELIMKNQLAGIRAAKALGMSVKVNTVYIPGLNDQEVSQIAKNMAALGVDLFNLMPHIPVPGSLLGSRPAPDPKELRDQRYLLGAYLPQMTHCRQCRADAVGFLRLEVPTLTKALVPNLTQGLAQGRDQGLDQGQAFKIAVISRSGVMVDGHLGQAERAYIFASDGSSSKLLEIREVGQGGRCTGCQASQRGSSGSSSTVHKPKDFIKKIVEALTDVDAVVALKIGESPLNLFKKCGILSFTSMDSIERAVQTVAKRLFELRSGERISPNETKHLALA